MQSYVVASDGSTDTAIGDSPCESSVLGYEVASNVSTDTGDK